ncbi:MAG: hypothetical protein OHK0037_25040 [Elainellaceae cyanobacterium]
MAPSLDRFPYTPQLRSLMQQAGIPSFAALAHHSGLSTWQIDQLRRGKVLEMRTGAIARLSQTLNTTISDLIIHFSQQAAEQSAEPFSEQFFEQPAIATPSDPTDASVTLQQLQKEYERLQRQLEQQQAEAVQACQRSALLQLEPLIEKLPVFLSIIEKNPDFLAKQLVPHLQPIERLLASWGVTSIEPIGSETGYDPQKHELMESSGAIVQPGDRIRVRFAGYYWGDRLLFRAKVSPV